jgi:hypothetical protein
MQRVEIPQGAKIKRVTIFYDVRDHVTGFLFLDKHGM